MNQSNCTKNCELNIYYFDWDFSRFSNEDRINYEDDPTIKREYQGIEKHYNKLPEEEQTVLRLYYVQELTQRQIAGILDLSQGAVSVRLKRLQKRLRFYLTFKPISEHMIDSELKIYLCKIERQILKLMQRTFSPTETLRQISHKYPHIKFTYTKIRYLFNRTHKRLKEINKIELNKYVNLIDTINSNFYINTDMYKVAHKRHHN